MSYNQVNRIDFVQKLVKLLVLVPMPRDVGLNFFATTKTPNSHQKFLN
jgi:hypothetical protein